MWAITDGTEFATISEDGVVSGKKAGTVTVTATNGEGVAGTYEVFVISPCVELLLDTYEVTMPVDSEKEITAILSPKDCTDKVTWRSEDENVVEVTGDEAEGKNTCTIKSTGTGQTRVIAKADSGKESICTVKVTQSIEKCVLNGVPEEMTYTGSALEPEVKVIDNGKVLTKEVDYTVIYNNNVNVGTATVTVTGRGFYSGSKTAAFEIVSSGTENPGGTSGGGTNQTNSTDSKDSSQTSATQAPGNTSSSSAASQTTVSKQSTSSSDEKKDDDYVENKCKKIKAAKKSCTIARKGKKVRLTFKFTLTIKNKRPDEDFTCRIGNKKVAKIQKIGYYTSGDKLVCVVKGVKKGTTTLKVSCNGKKATTKIRVKK